MFSGVLDGRRVLAAVFGLLLAPFLAAQSQETPPTQVLDILKLPRTQRLVISRIQGPIVLDGRLDEPAWQALSPFVMVMQTPNFGDPSSERSEVVIGFDDSHVYVGARMFDRESDKIQSPTKKRDTMTATWTGSAFLRHL